MLQASTRLRVHVLSFTVAGILAACGGSEAKSPATPTVVQPQGGEIWTPPEPAPPPPPAATSAEPPPAPEPSASASASASASTTAKPKPKAPPKPAPKATK